MFFRAILTLAVAATACASVLPREPAVVEAIRLKQKMVDEAPYLVDYTTTMTWTQIDARATQA